MQETELKKTSHLGRETSTGSGLDPNSEAAEAASVDAIEERLETVLDQAAADLEVNLRAEMAPDLGNIALAPDEIATLHLLVERYDQVLLDLDSLNGRLESLLQSEGIKGCES